MNAMADLAGSTWSGTSELWLDPLGDQVIRGECTIAVEADGVRYTWTHEGDTHQGRIRSEEDAWTFSDTYHQSKEPMVCQLIPELMGLLQIQGRYGPENDWGWRIGLSHRAPTDELVLQMTNVAPWGEEARAVRMVGRRDEG